MAEVSEMRAWLKANRPDLDVPDRGRLGGDLEDAYTDGTGDTPAEPDLPPDPVWAPDELEPDTPLQPERKPRTVRQTRADSRASARRTRGGFLGRLIDPPAKPQTRGQKKKTPARVGLDKLITRLYMRAGQMTMAVAPCTGRCLQAQAAMAGVILEDVAANTLVDRALQPVARAEDKLDKVFALAAPPLLVFAAEVTDPTDAVRRGLIMGLLRESLTISLEVTADYADRIEAQVKRHAETEADVDRLIALIFGVPQGETVPEPEMAGAAA